MTCFPLVGVYSGGVLCWCVFPKIGEQLLRLLLMVAAATPPAAASLWYLKRSVGCICLHVHC